MPEPDVLDRMDEFENKELEAAIAAEFGVSEGDTGAPASQEPEPEPAPAPSVATLDALLPDDPELAPTYRGKKTVKELWEERRQLTHQTNNLGQKVNELEAELRATRAALEVMGRGGQQREPETPKPTRPTQIAGVDLALDLAVDPNEAIDRTLTAFGGQLTQQTKQEIDQVRAELAQLRLQREVEAAQRASEVARAQLNLDGPEWAKRLNDIIVIVANDKRPNAMFDPAVYVEAHETIANRWLPRQQQTQQRPAVIPTQGSAGVGGASASTMRTSAPDPGASLPKRLRESARALAEEFGIDPKVIEAEIAEDYKRGVIR